MGKEMWFTSTMEYYSATEKKEMLPFATTWVEIESICQVK